MGGPKLTTGDFTLNTWQAMFQNHFLKMQPCHSRVVHVDDHGNLLLSSQLLVVHPKKDRGKVPRMRLRKLEI